MSTFWTVTKTALALGSVAILAAPTLRRLGFLPPADDAAQGTAQSTTPVTDPSLGEARAAAQPHGNSNEAGNGAEPSARH